MMTQYGPGMYMRRDFGAAVCPHCKKPFVKVNKLQITCGADRCRTAQNKAADRILAARRKGGANAATIGN